LLVEGCVLQFSQKVLETSISAVSHRLDRAAADNPVLQEVYQRLAEVRGTTKEVVERTEAQHTALKRSPRMAEVANAAVLLASDYASAITATPVNASCGELVD